MLLLAAYFLLPLCVMVAWRWVKRREVVVGFVKYNFASVLAWSSSR